MLPSRVGFLRNERTQSYYLDSKLLFSCVLFYLGAFGTVWLPYSVQNRQNWCKSSCYEVASEFFAKNTTDPPPLDPKLMFLCISYYLGAFGTVWLPYKTRCKTGQTGEKLRAMKSHRNFSQQTQPIRRHWTLNSCVLCVSYYLGAFGTVWLCYNT